MWPRRDDETETQRFGPIGMVVSLAGAFIGMPGAFVFLAVAWYGAGGPRFWILGLGFLAFGLWGLWQMIFGARSKPGKIPRDRR